MNREVFDLALLFTSAFVGATIAFLAALVTFTFHHEIRERLLRQGLIVPPNEPRPANLALLLKERQRRLQENHDRDAIQVRAFPVIRLPLGYNPEDDPNRHLRRGDFPAAFAAWRNRNDDPWEAPPDRRPRRLPTQGNIWDPHPQYILDWDQPLVPEQQSIDVLPTYQCRPVTGESTLARTSRRLRRQNPVPFPTSRRAIGLPSTSNDDPAQTSDTDTLVDRDIPEQIRICPDVPEDIPTRLTVTNETNKDQRTSRDLLLLETRGEEDVFNIDGPDFEWPELSEVDREIMGVARTVAWEWRQHDVENRSTNGQPGLREPMALYLALNQGEPLGSPDATPLSERLELNANREIWDPTPGRRILTLRPRTADEQTALEDTLAGVVWQEHPWRSRAIM